MTPQSYRKLNPRSFRLSFTQDFATISYYVYPSRLNVFIADSTTANFPPPLRPVPNLAEEHRLTPTFYLKDKDHG